MRTAGPQLRRIFDSSRAPGSDVAGRLPGHAALGAFRPVSAHAEALTLLALAGLAAVGVILATIHVLERRHPPA